MAGDDHSPPIQSRADLIEAMAQGAKPRSAWRVGTEHEKHVFYRDPIAPVPYEGTKGVHALLDGIEPQTSINTLDNVVREDVVGDTLSTEAALSNAPKKNEAFIKVPKVLG